jgi:uncharacterized protein involved in exopolysaccharide biosynthesis
MPEKLAVDLSFIQLILGLIVSFGGGAYAMYRLLRKLVRADIKTLAAEFEKVKKDVAECEEQHVYQDEFNRVADQVKAIYEHLLGKQDC